MMLTLPRSSASLRLCPYDRGHGIHPLLGFFVSVPVLAVCDSSKRLFQSRNRCEVPRPAGVRVVDVETGADLKRACEKEWEDADLLVMAAAVCDFKPRAVEQGKLKRRDGLTLELETSEDILAGLAKGKGKRILVGFALETGDEIEEGKRKLREKNLDLVMVNNPLAEGAGFGSDKNSGHLVFPDGKVEDIPLVTKLDLAEKIFDAVSSRLGSTA